MRPQQWLTPCNRDDAVLRSSLPETIERELGLHRASLHVSLRNPYGPPSQRSNES